MPAAKLCFIEGESALASHGRMRSNVTTAKITPLTKTAPSACGQAIPSAVSVTAMKAFSPM